MSKLIPQTFIDNLLSRVNIVEIIGTRINLRPAGSNFIGLCPFHNEKTPSFTVNQKKQLFHCFGCGLGGSAISFIMQFEQLGFVEAVKNLATYAGLVMPQDETNDDSNYNELYKIMEITSLLFEKQLLHHKNGINYLKSRGFASEICKNFHLGYATNSWDNLQPIHKASQQIKQQLITAGLLITKDNKTYSRFRDRIMLPIRNTHGKIVGFGGRILDNNNIQNQSLAKYLNSPETAIFHKSEELYGLYEAKKANHNLKFIIVVEGYLDVISLSQFGITNSVATLGTAISTKQIQLLLRNTSEVIFCFDGDKAGRSAAWRALENSLPLMHDGICIKFLFLPEGDDPDSLIKKEHRDIFSKRLESAISLTEFFFKQLLSDININTIEGKSKMTKIGKERIKKMPRGIFKKLMLSKIAELANIDPEELDNLDNNSTESLSVLSTKYITNDNKNNDILNNITLPIQNAISILLNYPEHIVSSLKNIYDIENIKVNGIDLLKKLIDLLKNHPKLSVAAIIENWRDNKEYVILSTLAARKQIISTENLKHEFLGIIQLLKRNEIEHTIKNLLAKASVIGLTDSEKLELKDLIALSKNKDY